MITLTKPQLASSEIPDIYTQVTWPKIIQPKLDGICCLAVNGVAMSRTMKPIPNKFIQKFFADNNLHGLHGELMIKGDFNDVQSGVMRVEGEPDFYYVVYDRWDSTETYLKRVYSCDPIIESLGAGRVTDIDVVSVGSPEECEKMLGLYLAEGFEGAMLRDPDSLYKQGRHTLKSQALMKLKQFFDSEATIIGFEEKMHNENEKTKDERGYSKRSQKKEGMVPAGTLGALIVKWEDVEFKIGSGYTDDQRQELWDNKESLLGKLTTFKFQELSKYGIPRFPVFKCIREEFND
jgi:DNA ligase 1